MTVFSAQYKMYMLFVITAVTHPVGYKNLDYALRDSYKFEKNVW